MQTWEDILATAVLGTEQRELSIASNEPGVSDLLRQVDIKDREAGLLTAASIVSLYRRSGTVPPSDTQSLLDPCLPDETSRSSPVSAQHLTIMLAGEHREVLPEWLALTKGANQRVPEEHLPALLDHGTSDAANRELICAVLGLRGEWLARQNPDWSYAVPKDDQSVWETGTRDERLLLLSKLRRVEPDKARNLVLSTWLQEPAKDRATILEWFAIGLTPGDEPFLNDALSDRSLEVRRVARKLLGGMRSEFSQKLQQLASEIFSFKKPLLGKAKIEVALPEDPIAWLNDRGVEIDSQPKHAARLMGDKGWFLKELISLIPIRHWSEAWKRSAREILSAAEETEWLESFALGFAFAAKRERDSAWLEALIQWNRSDLKQPLPTDLGFFLPANRIEALSLQFLKSDKSGLSDVHRALPLLLAHRSAWSDELSRAVVAGIKKRINRSKDNIGDWQTKAAIRQFARYVSPALYDEFAVGWPMDSESWSSWSKSVVVFHSVLSFRRDMHKAIFEKEQKL